MAFTLQFNVYSQNDSLKGGQLYSSNFLIDDIQRDFVYYMPAHYGDSDLYPLVIFLHSEGESAQSAIKSYGATIQQIADTSNCIVIYPDAVQGRWNVKSEESRSGKDSVNDVSFISILIDYFIQVYHADPKRIYLIGFLTGGELAWQVICTVPLKITAIAAFPMIQNTNQCKTNNVIVMPTDQYIDFSVKKNYVNAIFNAWKFFTSHQKQ